MPRTLSFGLCCVTLVIAGAAHAVDVIQGDIPLAPNSNLFEDPCELFRGDLGAEFGVGCSHGLGPGFAAVGVTAPFPTPLYISSYYYNIQPGNNSAVTALTFTVWAGGEIPGARIGSQAGLNFSAGYHTVPVVPAIAVSSSQFFFGAIQPQPDTSLFWGVDISSGGGGANSFLKFPSCGVTAWITMTSVGIAGDWTMAVCVSAPVPVELESWGQIKRVWN